jgi:hypothetical protein
MFIIYHNQCENNKTTRNKTKNTQSLCNVCVLPVAVCACVVIGFNVVVVDFSNVFTNKHCSTFTSA